MRLLFFSIILIWIIAMTAQFYCDSLLLNKFSDEIEYEDLNNGRNYKLRLLNLKFHSFLLPSYRGRYQSIVLPDMFNLNINGDFISLSTNSPIELQRKNKKIHKTNCKIKKDIFAGNLLLIQINEFKLTFKVPKDFEF